MIKSTILALISGMCFGMVGFFGVKLLSQGFSLTNLLFWRFLIASIILGSSLVYTGKLKFSLYGFLIGAVFYFISSFCFFNSIKFIGSGLTTALFYSFPVFTAIFSFFSSKKKIGILTIIALILMIIGVLLISEIDNIKNDLFGICLAFISSIICAIYFIVCKNIIGKVGRWNALFSICVGNLVSLSIFSIITQDFKFKISLNSLLYIIILALIGTVIANLTLFSSLKKISATKAAILSIAEPITGLLLAIIFLNEKITITQLIGCAFTIIAAVTAHFDKEDHEINYHS